MKKIIIATLMAFLGFAPTVQAMGDNPPVAVMTASADYLTVGQPITFDSAGSTTPNAVTWTVSFTGTNHKTSTLATFRGQAATWVPFVSDVHPYITVVEKVGLGGATNNFVTNQRSFTFVAPVASTLSRPRGVEWWANNPIKSKAGYDIGRSVLTQSGAHHGLKAWAHCSDGGTYYGNAVYTPGTYSNVYCPNQPNTVSYFGIQYLT